MSISKDYYFKNTSPKNLGASSNTTAWVPYEDLIVLPVKILTNLLILYIRKWVGGVKTAPDLDDPDPITAIIARSRFLALDSPCPDIWSWNSFIICIFLNLGGGYDFHLEGRDYDLCEHDGISTQAVDGPIDCNHHRSAPNLDTRSRTPSDGHGRFLDDYD